MMNTKKSQIHVAVGTALMGSMAASAVAAENPFTFTDLPSGYMVASADGAKAKEGKCGEAKCGADKARSGACGSYLKKADQNNDGTVTREEFTQYHTEKFNSMDKNGDSVIDASEMKAGEGKCGAAGKAKEGKCGEGKCGGKK